MHEQSQSFNFQTHSRQTTQTPSN